MLVIVTLALLISALSMGCTGSGMRLAVVGPGGGEQYQAPGMPVPGGWTPSTSTPDISGTMGAAPTDKNLQDALAGIRDYEVTYDTSKSHAENTPPQLRELGVIYAGDESPVAQRTKALNSLDLVGTLQDRYKIAEEKFAASPDKDYDPDNPDRTLNYMQPRADPFAIPDQIPEELRPKVEGEGLEGSADPKLLEQLFWSQYQANLRYLPIIVIGVIQAGPYRGVIYTIAGTGFTDFLQEGQSRCYSYQPAFSLTVLQVSEDYVVMSLTGTYDRRCQYPATQPVIRTFHVNR